VNDSLRDRSPDRDSFARNIHHAGGAVLVEMGELSDHP